MNEVDAAFQKLADGLKLIVEARKASDPMWTMWANMHGVESADAAFAIAERVQERVSSDVSAPKE